MKPTILSLVAIGVVWAAGTMTAAAQQYQIDWFTIAGGGGTSTGGVFSVSGTIGQSDAGTMSGGNFTLQGGFWSVLGVVQTPSAPFLSLSRSGASVVLSWPATSSTFRLLSAPSLNGTPAWAQVGITPVVVSGTNYVTNAVAAGYSYFRLANP